MLVRRFWRDEVPWTQKMRCCCCGDLGVLMLGRQGRVLVVESVREGFSWDYDFVVQGDDEGHSWMSWVGVFSVGGVVVGFQM